MTRPRIISLLYDKRNDREIRVFNAFRFIFFIFIFVRHTYDLNELLCLRYPTLAVSGFIILSGFLNGYIYRDRADDISVRSIAAFAKKRIDKFYPLHLVTLLAVLPKSRLFQLPAEGQPGLLLPLLSNITLTQSWINDREYYFGFNGVSWFLSTYIFLALITLPVLKLIGAIRRSRAGKAGVLIAAAAMFAATLPVVRYVGARGMNAEFWLYIFPPARMFEYIIGLALGTLAERPGAGAPERSVTIKYTIYEAAAFALMAFMMYRLPEALRTSPWFSDKMNLYLIPLALLIFVCSGERGLISRVLSNNALNYLGNLSMYMFLSHQVIIKYMDLKVPRGGLLCVYILAATILVGVIADKYYRYKAATERRE